MKSASIVITDGGCDFNAFMKTLKERILKDAERWRNCSQTRFVVLNGDAAVLERIHHIIEPNSPVKNTDMTDRAYFLGMVLKHISQDIWDKVDKNLYRRKFASIGIENSFEDVSCVWASQTLAELVEQKFSEDESIGIQISMGETFEMIRSGEFALIAATDPVKDPDEKEALARELSR